MTGRGGGVALVTGAGRGIGADVARALASLGWSVAVNDVDAAAAQSVAESLQAEGARAAVVAGDVSRPGPADAVVEAAREALGGLDVLVNNAGIGGTGTRLQDLTLEAWDEMLRVDLTSVFLMCKAALPLLTQGGGRIVNVSSVTAFAGVAGSTHYAAAKAGVVGFSKALAHEVAADRVTVNVVAPGLIDTAMARRRGIDHQRDRVLWPRIGRTADVAHAVAYLTSEGAEFVTGQVLHVNGGAYM